MATARAPLHVDEAVEDMQCPVGTEAHSSEKTIPIKQPHIFTAARLSVLIATVALPTMVAVIRPPEGYVIAATIMQLALIVLSGKFWLTD